MDVGGEDLILEGPVARGDTEYLIESLKGEWPNHFVEEEWPPMYPNFLREVFVYRDKNMKTSWDVYGRTPDNADALVTILVEDDCISMVVDQKSSPIGKRAQAILDELHRRRTS
jgi:hypothetical protein